MLLGYVFHSAVFLSDSEVDDEVIDERPLKNKSDDFPNLMNHVNEQMTAVSFSDEGGQKDRYSE